jgi:aquaporin Z
MVMIYTLGRFSGAHFNPAVSFGFLLDGSMDLADFFAYLVVQIIGGVGASYLLRILFPESATLGGTLTKVSLPAAFAIEALLAFFLMFVILRVTTAGEKAKLISGLVIGCTVGLAALAAGPMTGASMNPARSLAPAVAAQIFEGLWIYLTAPFLGASLAVLVNKAFIRSTRA